MDGSPPACALARTATAAVRARGQRRFDMITFLIGVAAGVVLKILVPMPFLDDHVRDVWRWLKSR